MSLNLDNRRGRLEEWDSRNLSLENQRRIGKNENPYANVEIWKNAEAAKVATTHTIKEGDTLSQIADKYDVAMDKLLRVNELADANDIKIGKMIKLERSKTQNDEDALLLEASQILIDQIKLEYAKSLQLMGNNAGYYKQ